MSKQKNEDNQELMIELKTLDEELKKLNTHLENMDNQMGELEISKQIINKFSELNKGDELRVPLTSGIYVKAQILDTKNLMINVGSNITVEKTPKQVTKILDGQLTELSKYRDQLVGQMKVLINRIEEIQSGFEA
ncbi:prefoldin subunit alpha [archaeon]|jgi:prefoldin alpha subunit|nr:prefoldin subunit alpha [archaeon]MBT4022511.1 prefoldin subunit alpha [archaeon]MBT4272350.1 prefoldin subunit alpha [archaeon]MBT4460459.1 prefoldin subunit alpha [archaeon]MBT4858478.1 prefoldin subunit alpha [archaeon]